MARLKLITDIAAFWDGLSENLQAAAVGGGFTLLAALFGFGAVAWQIRSQGKQSREAILSAERRKLKTEMYETGITTCRDLSDKAIDLSTFLRTMKVQVEVAAKMHAVGGGYQTPRARYLDFLGKYDAFANTALQFIFLVENRRIFDPRLLIFRTAISSVLHSTRELLTNKFHLSVLPILPIDGPDGEVLAYTPPSLEAMEAGNKLADEFLEQIGSAIAYVEDFIVELQNLLLGDLFPHPVEHRIPLDSNQVVIRLDEFETLETWFRENTEMGKHNAKIETETAQKFAPAPPQ